MIQPAIVFFAIFIILILFSAFNKTPSPFTEENGIFSNLDTDRICKILGGCSSNNASSIYGRAFWPREPFEKTLYEETAYILGARKMSLQDAVVVYGQVVYPYTYWALTGYLYDIPDSSTKDGRLDVWASIGDSVSSSRYPCSSDFPSYSLCSFTGQYVVIMTANVNVYEYLKKNLANRFTNPLFIPMIIPQIMYSEEYRYNIMSRVVPAVPGQALPKWNTFFATVQDTGITTLPQVPLIQRMNPNSELDIISLQNWFLYSLEIVKDSSMAKGYKIDRVYVAKTFLSGVIPDGLNYGYQCLEYKQRCRADNRDTIYLTIQEVPVNPDSYLAIVAIDHNQTTKAKAYSNIDLYDAATEQAYDVIITGRAGGPPFTTLDKATELIYNKPPEGVTSVDLVERIYVDTTSGVGPKSGSVLPAIMYVLSPNK